MEEHIQLLHAYGLPTHHKVKMENNSDCFATLNAVESVAHALRLPCVAPSRCPTGRYC